MDSLAADLSAGPPVNRFDVDRPTLGSSTTRQALKGQSLWLEVQDHVMPAQSTDAFPQLPDGEAHKRDRTNGGRGAWHGPPGRVSACGKHGRSKSNESANVTMVGVRAIRRDRVCEWGISRVPT